VLVATCFGCGAAISGAARFCPSCGQPVGTPRPTIERKLATVLFADLAGSTASADSEDPERTRARLDRFYDAMSTEIGETGGTVEKFAGDAVMAVFGAPAAHEDHAERALGAALSMQRRLEEVFGSRFRLRIGINTGEVVVGEPRVGSSFASGDVVNVAARLEQAAAPGEILVAERTVAATLGTFEFDDARTIAAKGKPEGVVCRRLVRARSPSRPQGRAAPRPAFVGRRRELELLQAAYGRVVGSGRPELITLVGDAGVGKTRMAREACDRLDSAPAAPRTLTGRCPAYGRGITYRALAEVLTQHLGGAETEPELLLAELEDGAILGLTFGLEAPVDLHPLIARRRLEAAWLRLLEGLTVDRPVVLLVEDLHWAEDPLLDLLERVVDELPGELLVLGTARPDLFERRPDWGDRGARSHRVWLEPLSAEDAEQIVDQLLGPQLPAPLRTLVTSWAEGNPLFLEEFIAMLIDQGVLERADDGWSARDLPTGYTIPDSVQSLLASRIDLLSPTEKATLQAAAVIGRTFWPSPLRELLEGDEPDLRALEERDFIRRSSAGAVSGDEVYAFKHALIREVAYGSLPKAGRARKHAAFARWLEARRGGRDEDAAFLAHHYAEAARSDHADLAWPDQAATLRDLRAKAIAWLQRAADLATARYALDEAIALLHRALELEPSVSDQVELWRAIGRASVLNFDGESFWTAMLRAADLCPDPETVATIYADLAIETATRSGMWKGRPAEGVVDGWIGQALARAPRDSAARAKALAASSYFHADAKGAAGEAREIAERIGDDELRSFAVDGLTATTTAAREYREAYEWAKLRLSIVREIGDPDHRAEAHLSAICACLGVGRMSEARDLARTLADMTAELTPHHRFHAIAFRLLVEAVDGRWDSIRALAERAEQAVAANEATPCVVHAFALVACATAHTYAADLEEAHRLEHLADAVFQPSEENTAARISLALARGDISAVAELLPAEPPSPGGRPPWDVYVLAPRLDALAVLRARERVEAEAPPFLKAGTYLEPFALRALGVVLEEAEFLQHAIARFEAMELRWHAAQTGALLAAIPRQPHAG
jgi:class 3 adenylate cyclase